MLEKLNGSPDINPNYIDTPDPNLNYIDVPDTNPNIHAPYNKE